jgi:acetyl esterase/lipase
MNDLVRPSMFTSLRACACALAAATMMSLWLPAAATAATAGPVSVLRDARYAVRGSTPLTLDAWKPGAARAKQRRPMVVMVHGGGWRAGSRYEWARNGWPQTFAATGYVVVAPSYRLACEVPEPDADGVLPAGVELCGHTMADQRADVVEAVRWSIRNASRLGGDPSRIVLVGGSAGGHLALLAAASPALAGRVVGVAAISPPVDLPMIGRRDLWLRGAVERAIRCSWAECPDRWRLHSPIDQLAGARSLPATYLYASRNDLRVRRVDVLRLARTMRARGASVTVREPIVTSSACHGPWACERFAVRQARMPLRRDVLRWLAQVTARP